MNPDDVSFKGPAGETKISLSRGNRLGASVGFLSLTGLLFSVWAGAYLVRKDQQALLGTPLSAAHYNIRGKCAACHQPGQVGVANSACAGKDCHQKVIHNNFHQTLPLACTECHPEHNNARDLPASMTNRACAECHQKLNKDPHSKFFTGQRQPHALVIDHRLFLHRQHRGYHCPVCHGVGEGTIDVPFKELFTMKVCCKCHEESGCQVCHHFHGQRVFLSKPDRPHNLEKIKELKSEGVQLDLPPSAGPPGGAR